MKEKLTLEEYEKIEQLVDYAINVSNKKEAQKYIKQMQSYEYGLCGSVSCILSELICYVKDASGKVSDKERRIYSVRSKIYELECYGVEK
jgi:hypothetical protein